jgi:hypothetical protein
VQPETRPTTNSSDEAHHPGNPVFCGKIRAICGKTQKRLPRMLQCPRSPKSAEKSAPSAGKFKSVCHECSNAPDPRNLRKNPRHLREKSKAFATNAPTPPIPEICGKIRGICGKTQKRLPRMLQCPRIPEICGKICAICGKNPNTPPFLKQIILLCIFPERFFYFCGKTTSAGRPPSIVGRPS